SVPGVSPKKCLAKLRSSSIPKSVPIVPMDTPKFVRLSLQFVRLGQLPESPPKLYPTNGVIKPSARAGIAVSRKSAATPPSTRFVIILPPRSALQERCQRCGEHYAPMGVNWIEQAAPKADGKRYRDVRRLNSSSVVGEVRNGILVNLH